MNNTIRNDLFDVPVGSSLPHGYMVLRKFQEKSSKKHFLDEVLVTSDDFNLNSISGVKYHIRSTCLKDSIEDGDIALYTGKESIRIILTRKSEYNTVLVTERCDNRCLFCSQPPKERDDSWLLIQAALAIASFNTTSVVGISGGEPLIYGDRFTQFLDLISEISPITPLHILTNGRMFSDLNFTKCVSRVIQGGLKVTFGIPLYSTSAEIHNNLVGAEGAYQETVKGIINAGNIGLNIELRIIPTRHNSCDLPAVVELATRSMSGISQISIMNLEPTGWAKYNWPDLYINPDCYEDELLRSVRIAQRAQVPLVLFNYPLCHINPGLYRYAVKSISDWKNYYPDECSGCMKKDSCCGYFASSKGAYHIPARRLT